LAVSPATHASAIVIARESGRSSTLELRRRRGEGAVGLSLQGHSFPFDSQLRATILQSFHFRLYVIQDFIIRYIGFGGMLMAELIVSAIDAIYEAAPDPSRWPHALQAIADVFDDVGANLLWRRDDGSFGNIVSPKLRDALQDYEREEWWRQDIRAGRGHEYAYRTNEGAITDRHVATPEEIEAHPIYTRFLARHGLRWTAGTEISPDPTAIVTINVQRSSAKAAFTDDELRVLTQLGRYAEKSLRLSMRLFDAELSKAGLAEALARIDIGVFILDSISRVVFSNPAAEKLLCDGLALVNQRLLVGQSPERTALETAIAQAIHGGSHDLAAEPKSILIHRRQSDRPLIVYVLPIAAASKPEARFLTHASVIVLVIDPQAGDPADPAVVRDLLGLTLGEARVAALVGNGLSPRESAEKLNITEESARTVLKRVFSKVGVSRQSELVALLTKSVLR
jgi:DNA-binding CsgD family transcriptional regulator/PAS domain-containing protein